MTASFSMPFLNADFRISKQDPPSMYSMRIYRHACSIKDPKYLLRTMLKINDLPVCNAPRCKDVWRCTASDRLEELTLHFLRAYDAQSHSDYFSPRLTDEHRPLPIPLVKRVYLEPHDRLEPPLCVSSVEQQKVRSVREIESDCP